MFKTIEFTTRRIAEICGVTDETVRRWIKKGKLVGYYDCILDNYMIREYDLRNFLESNPRYYRKVKHDRQEQLLSSLSGDIQSVIDDAEEAIMQMRAEIIRLSKLKHDIEKLEI